MLGAQERRHPQVASRAIAAVARATAGLHQTAASACS